MKGSRHNTWGWNGDTTDGVSHIDDAVGKVGGRSSQGGGRPARQSVPLDEGSRHRRTASHGSGGGSLSITIPQPRSVQASQGQRQLLQQQQGNVPTPLGSFDFKAQSSGNSQSGNGGSIGKLLVPQGDLVGVLPEDFASPPVFPELLALNDLQQAQTSSVSLPPPPRSNNSRRCRGSRCRGGHHHQQHVGPLLLDDDSAAEDGVRAPRKDSDSQLRQLAPLLERAISSIMQAAAQEYPAGHGTKVLRSPTPGLAFSSSSTSAPANAANPRAASLHTSASSSQLTARSVHDLINDLVSKIDYGGYAATVFTAAIVYLARIPTNGSCAAAAATPNKLVVCGCARCAITESNWYRFTLVAILIATKVHAERSCRTRANEKFALATGFSLQELRQLEVEFLFLIDFSLMITKEEYTLWAAWVMQLGHASPSARHGLISPPACSATTPLCDEGSPSSSLTSPPQPSRLFSVMNGTEPDAWLTDDEDPEADRPPTPPALDATPPSFFRRPVSGASASRKAWEDEDSTNAPTNEHSAGEQEAARNVPVGLWGRLRQRLHQTPPQSPILATMQRLPLQFIGAAKNVIACMSRRPSHADEDESKDRPRLARLLMSHSPPM